MLTSNSLSGANLLLHGLAFYKCTIVFPSYSKRILPNQIFRTLNKNKECMLTRSRCVHNPLSVLQNNFYIAQVICSYI